MLKLGSVSYINALPLTYFLDPKEFEIIHAPPAQLFNLLDQGKVDAALLPIVNYFENRDLYLIPNLSIGAKGAVNSVKLFIKSNDLSIENINNIYLDPESRTSQLLLKVLLRDRYHRSLEEINFISDQSDPKVQAKLLIGDKALVYSNPPSPPFVKGGLGGFSDQQRSSFDLGELWTEWTQKPFVFAAWMTKDKNFKEGLSLQKSRDQGLQKIEEIIQSISLPALDFLKNRHEQIGCKAGGVPQSGAYTTVREHLWEDPTKQTIGAVGYARSLNEYFTKNLHYYMGPEELEGIKTFYQFLKPIEGYSNELDFRFVS